MPATTPDPLFVAFGAAITESRKERGLTQEALAERAEMNRTYLNDVEKGRRNISLFNIERLARALGMSAWELMREAEARHGRGG